MSYDRNRSNNATNRRIGGGGGSGGSNRLSNDTARNAGGYNRQQNQRNGDQRGGSGGYQQRQDQGGYSAIGARRLPPGGDMPLRMVVNAKYVGAIIGQGGANIRQITKDSKARCVVDVSRGIRDPTGIVEKVINIYGPADNCSKACLKILELVHRESQNDPANQGKNVEPELKLRAHNNLVGRLIGKGGSTIKKIMEETGCTVFVSNSDVSAAAGGSLQQTPNSGYSGERYRAPPPPPAMLLGMSPPDLHHRHALVNNRSPVVDYGAIDGRRMQCLTPSAVAAAAAHAPPPPPYVQNSVYSSRNFLHPSISELNAFNMERTITIRGTMSNIGQAEQRISAKLRQCWENDMLNTQPSMYAGGMMNPLMNAAPSPYASMDQYAGAGRTNYGQRSAAAIPPPAASALVHSHHQNAYAPPPHAYIPGGGGPVGRSVSAGGHQISPGNAAAAAAAAVALQHHALPPTMAAAATGGGPPALAPPGMLPSAFGGGRPHPRGVGPTEVVQIWVPHNMVGALIGTKGAQIRNITRLTGAHIRIESSGGPAKSESPTTDGSPNHENDHRQQQPPPQPPVSDADRRVTVTGNELQQYKAQFWIFQRVAEQGYRFIDDIRLCTEIMVPSKLVGRLIGKGGQNVRELQRHTGAQVKVPEDAVNSESEQTLVQIIGNFNAAHAVQSRVRQLLGQFAVQQYRSSMAGGDHEPA